MKLGAAAALAALLSAEEPEYPLGPLRFPSLTTSGQPLLLTDLRYSTRDEDATVQALAVRFRVGTWGFLSGGVDDQRRGLSLATQRLDLSFADNQGRYAVGGGFRAPGFSLRAGASRRPPAQGKGWVVDSQGAWRFGPDLEALAGFLGDTDHRTLRTRTLSRVLLGLLYQRGTHLDLAARFTRSRVRTEAGFDQHRNLFVAGGAGLLAAAEWEATLSYERTEGRLGHSEGFAEVELAAPVGGHGLAHGRANSSWQPGALRYQRDYLAGLTFFGRRVRLSRAGEAARRTVELARRACDLGYNERRVHDEDGRRELRERLALSPRREELREDVEALYRAQVAERNVPQAGFEVSDSSDRVRGTTVRSYRGFLGVPWPAAWPFRRSEDSVPFLRVDYSRREQRFDSGFSAVTHDLSLEAELNREMSVIVRWQKSGRTPIAVAREVPRTRSIELEYVYAFGH